MKYILAGLDESLKTGIRLTKKQIDDLVAFLSVGLLDPDARPAQLTKLIPEALPSGAGLPRFEADSKKEATASAAARIGEAPSVELVAADKKLSVRIYPNPFVDRATVDYNLPTGGLVRHTLLDAKGGVLRQAHEGVEQSAGHHQMHLSGVSLPPGTYLYRIQVGTESRTLRIVRKE